MTGGIRLFVDVTMMGTKEKVYDKFLDTTELLVAGSSHWRFAGNLPTSRWGLRGVSVNNRIIIAMSTKQEVTEYQLLPIILNKLPL